MLMYVSYLYLNLVSVHFYAIPMLDSIYLTAVIRVRYSIVVNDVVQPHTYYCSAYVQ